MTPGDLIKGIYTDYDFLRKAWKASFILGLGMLVYVYPVDWYEEAKDFSELDYDTWPLPDVRAFLAAAGQSQDELMNLLADLNVNQEFLVMIVEREGSEGRQTGHVYKISKVGLS